MKSLKLMLCSLVIACFLMLAVQARADPSLDRPPSTAAEVAALVALCGAPAALAADPTPCEDDANAYWWAIYHIGVEASLYDTDGTPTVGKYVYDGTLTVSLAVQAQMIEAWTDQMQAEAANDYAEAAATDECADTNVSSLAVPNIWPPAGTDPWLTEPPEWYFTPRDPVAPGHEFDCMFAENGALDAAEADLFICFDSCSTNCPDCVSTYFSKVALIQSLFATCLDDVPDPDTAPTCGWPWPEDPENEDPPCTIPGDPISIAPDGYYQFFESPYDNPLHPPRPIPGTWVPETWPGWGMKHLRWTWVCVWNETSQALECSFHLIYRPEFWVPGSNYPNPAGYYGLFPFNSEHTVIIPETFGTWSHWSLFTATDSPSP